MRFSIAVLFYTPIVAHFTLTGPMGGVDATCNLLDHIWHIIKRARVHACAGYTYHQLGFPRESLVGPAKTQSGTGRGDRVSEIDTPYRRMTSQELG